MKKIFLAIICISPSFLCSMEPEKKMNLEKPTMPASRSKSVSLGGNSPFIQVPLNRSRPRLDSDPMLPSPKEKKAIIQSVTTNDRV